MITFPFGFLGGSAATPEAIDLLLNNIPYSSGAFGLRKLDKNYTGSCIKVRESSGNTLADIGFDANGDLDTTALLAHVGSANGYVHTWYDQSGLGYDAVQTSNSVAQPRIVNSGTVDTLNSKPAMYFLAANNASFLLNNGGYGTMSTKYTAYVLANRSASGTFSPTLGGGTAAGYLSYLYSDNIYYSRDSAAYFASTSTYTDTDQHIIASINQASVLNMFRDGDAIPGSSGASVAASILTHIGFSGNNYATGYLQEIVYYDEDRYPELTRLMSDVGAKYRGWSDYSLFSTEFDGVADYVVSTIDGTSTGNFGSGAAKEFTISFWFKAPDISVTDALVNWGTSNPASTSVGVMIWLQSTRIRYYVMGTWGDSPSFPPTIPALAADTWYHIALTRTASDNTNRIYINGVEDTGNAKTGTLTTNESSMEYIALMDGYYGNLEGNMDEVSMFTTALSQSDITSIYNGGVPNDLTSLSPYAWWRMGDESGHPYLTNKMAYSKYSMNFDGVDDYVEIASTAFQFSGDFSISFWVNPTTYQPLERFIDYTYFSGGHGYAFYFDGLKIKFGTWNNNTGKITASTTSVSLGTWYHAVAVFDLTNNIQRIYINGVQEATVAVTVSPTYTNVTKLGIGARLQGTDVTPREFINANMDEVAFFNSALSAANVTTIYNSGVPNDISGLNPISYYKMGEGAIFPQIPNEMAYSKQSMNFDGVADYVSTSATIATLGITNKFTVSCWIKADTLVGSWEGVIGCVSSDAWTDGFAIYMNSSGAIGFWINHYTNNLAISSTSTISTGTWYHVLACYDGSLGSNNMELFVDGVSVATDTLTANVTDNSGTLCMADISSGGFHHGMNGNVDDFAIWNTDKRADVATIYNSGVPNDISALSPVGWWKVGDGDYFPTLTDSGSGSNDGTATNMSGADIEFETPNGWGTAYNETAAEMIQGVTANGNGGTMTNMAQAGIVQDAPT